MLGAALATGFSPIVSMSILSIFFLRKKNSFRIEKTNISIRTYVGICSLGLASFISEFGFGIVMMLINKLFISLGGDTAVAAFAIIINVFYVVNAIFNGVASGTQPMISFSYGENDHKKIRQVLRYALITVAGIAVVMYIVLFFGADGIAKIFNSQGEERLQALASQGIKLYFISSLFSGFNLLFSCYFAASNRGLYAQIITILRGVVLIIPIAYLFAILWQITGLWLATPAAEFITLAVALTIFFATRKSLTTLEAPAYVKE